MIKKLFYSTNFKISFLVFFLSCISVNAQWNVDTTTETPVKYFMSDRAPSGAIYSVIQDGTNSNKISVMKQNGTTWTYDLNGTGGTIGKGLTTGIAYYPTMKVDPSNGNIYITYVENISSSYKITCQKFDGTSWSFVGSNAFASVSIGGSPSIDVNNGNVIITAPGLTANTFKVFKFNGTSWIDLLAGASNNLANLSTEIDYINYWGYTTIADPSKGYQPLITAAGDVYVAYNQGPSGLRVSKYNASTTNWSQLGANITNTGIGSSMNPRYMKLAMDATGQLYLGFYDAQNNSYRGIAFFKYNTVNQSWTNLSSSLYSYTSGSTNINGFSFDIAFDSANVPYVLYTELNNYDVYLKKYTGSWTGVATWGGYNTPYKISSDVGMRLFMDATDSPIRVSTLDVNNNGANVFSVHKAPSLDVFTATSGSVGSTIAIYAINTANITGVYFNGVASTYSYVDNTRISATIPSGATTGPISLTSNFGNFTASTNFNIIALSPTITSFTPTSGPTGTSMTITGTSFTGATTVTIGGTAVSSFTVNSDTSITAVVPAATSGTVQVTTSAGVATSTTNFDIDPALTVTGTSAITSMVSCKNISSVAQTFTVGGTNLTSNISITSDDTTNIQFSTDNSTFSSSLTLTATSGTVANTTVYMRIALINSAMAAATKNVTITSGTLSQAFSFTARRENTTPTLSLMSLTAGNFGNTSSNTVNLYYNSANYSPTQFSVSAGTPALAGFSPITNQPLTATKLTFPIPANSTPGSYNFNITVNNGCTSSAYSTTVIITATPPIITTIVPVSASTGNSVTLTGQGFSTVFSENKLYLSGMPCTITAATTTSLTFTVPAGASTGKLYYTNTNSGLTTVSDEDFIAKFTYPPGISTLLPGNYLGNGSITLATNYGGLSAADIVSVADFNSDQKPDLVTFQTTSANYTKLNYFTNNSIAGNVFQTSDMNLTNNYYSYYSLNATGHLALLGDYDGDGDLDIYGTVSGFAGATWFKNESSGSTVTLTSKGDVANSVRNDAANVIDMERDGKLDVLALYTGEVSTFKNTIASPTSNFSLIQRSLSSTNLDTNISRTGDVDKNGTQDFLFSFTTGIRIRQNGIESLYSGANEISLTTASIPNDIRLTDLDLDGKNDLVFSSGTNNLSVFRNLSTSGAIAFDSQLNFATGNGNTSNYAICVTDVNNDGLPDVLVSGSAKLVLFINNSTPGTISFLAPQDLGAPAKGLASLKAIDLNGDGYMDIVGSDKTSLKYFIFTYIPTITTTGTSSITELSACINSPSAAQSFTVSGTNLTANLTVTSNDSTNIEFSTDATNYSNSLTFTPTSGTVGSTTVYVRQKSSASVVASATKTVTIASTGATSATFSFTRLVNNTTISTQPLSTARTYCQNTTPIDLSVTATGLGLTYQWYSNTVNTSTTGATLINGATSSTYTPLTSSISALYYYCVVTGTCSTLTSNFSGKITISTPSVGGIATANSSSICTNSSTTITLSGNTGTIQWQQSSDGATGWANVTGGTGATSATYTTPALTTTTYYRAAVTKSGCSSDYSSTALITVSPTSIAGTPTASSNPVCSGSTTDLTLTNFTGNIQWQSSTNNSTWNNINGANASTYTTPAISATSYYKAVVTSGSCAAATSATITITLNTVLAITTHPASTAQNICLNGTASPLSVIATGSGLTYQWYSNSTASTSGSTLIPNATSATFIPDTTSVTALYYYCEVTGACSSLTSSISGLITIIPSSVAGTPTVSSNSICAGSTTDLTLTGYTGLIQWQSSINNSTWNNINGASTDTYTTASLSTTTYYKAIVTNSSCTAAISSIITVTVNPRPSISLTSILYNATYSVNSQNISINYSATNGNPTNYNISWTNNPNNNLTPVTNSSLPSSPITISIPGGANLGTYSGILTVENADFCTSVDNAFTINIDNGDTTPPIITYPISQNNNGNYGFKISENTANIITYTANETVTWSITGGSEQNLFSIDSNTGVLSFINPPFYANPTDSAPTNSYIVEITATDGNGNVSRQTLTVTISPFCGSWGN